MGDELHLEVSAQGADAERLDELTRQLRDELLELDVVSVSVPVLGPPPPGAKALDIAAIGALLVTLKGSVELVEKVVATIRAWLGRGASEPRQVVLTVGEHSIELAAATEQQQQSLVDEFLRMAAAD
jgi:hypothetical protein